MLVPQLKFVCVLFVAAILPGVAAPPAAAQTESDVRDLPRVSDVIERTEVRVLIVDVFVADNKGNSIDDLELGDFELLIDGDPVEIDSFEHRTFELFRTRWEAPIEPEPEARAPARTARRVVFFFDAYNSTMIGQARVRKHALDYMEKNLFPADEVMVLSFSDRLEIIQEFTRDPELWVEAVQRLAEKEADRLPTHRSEGERRLREVERLAGLVKPDRFEKSRTDCAAAWGQVRAYAQEEWNRSIHTVEILEGLVFALGGIPGRKSIVYISEGLDETPAIDLIRAASTRYCAGHASRVDPEERTLKSEFRLLFEKANAANVTFHTIDARTNEIGAHPFLTDLAFQTGGTRGTASARTSKNLEMLARQMASYYVLGHTLQSPEPDGRTHNIVVNVNRPDVRVRHRRKFSDLGWRKRDENSVLGALAIPELYRDLPLEAQIIPIRVGDKDFETYIEIGIPVEQLFWLPYTGTHLGEFEFIGAITDRRGRVVFEFGEILELTRDGDRTGGGEGLFYRSRTVLNPGDYELVALSHDLGNGRIGAVRSEFRISDRRPESLAVDSVVLAKISRGDLVVGDYSSTPLEQAATLPRKYRKERVVPVFQGDPVTRRDSLVTYFQLQDPELPGPDSDSKLKITVNFYQFGERQFSMGPVSVDRAEIDPDGTLPIAIVAPLRRFRPGTYDVRIEVKREAWSEVLWRKKAALTIIRHDDGERTE